MLFNNTMILFDGWYVQPSSLLGVDQAGTKNTRKGKRSAKEKGAERERREKKEGEAQQGMGGTCAHTSVLAYVRGQQRERAERKRERRQSCETAPSGKMAERGAGGEANPLRLLSKKKRMETAKKIRRLAAWSTGE
jgi:hypothetical protein